MNARGTKALTLLMEATACYADEARDATEMQAFMQEVELLKQRFMYRVEVPPIEIGNQDLPHVFLAMPHTQGIEAETMVAAFGNMTAGKFWATILPLSCSALSFGFNQLWCKAAVDQKPFKYWFMLHSDANPHGHWGDILIEEMEAGDFDVMHAVMAIKDENGLSSTAVGRKSHMNWNDRRRLAMDEIHRLPPTFSYEDVVKELGTDFDDGCLYNNTGVMCVRIGAWADRFPGFCQHDRIVRFFPETGVSIPMEEAYLGSDKWVPRAEFIPEDWNFGAWCARNNLKVGGTRRVTTQHFGRSAFPNHMPWGNWKRDEYFFERQSRWATTTK